MSELERGLIDTSVVIDFSEISTDALPGTMAISAITMAELAAGPHATADPEERARRQQLLQWVEGNLDPLPFDAAAARAYGMIYATTRAAGRTSRRRVVDLMIAAVAEANGLPLLTRNPHDFAGLASVVHVIAL